MNRAVFAAVGVFAILAAPVPATAQAVDVELVLAADGSGSIDMDEFRLQREGYAAAITHPDVLAAIRGGRNGAIALAYIEWGAPESQHTIVDWQVIASAADAERFARALRTAPREAYGYNSISGAIDYAANLIHSNRFDALAKVIDVSGDGPQRGGRPVQAARDDAVAAGITINGLVVKRPGGGYPGPSGEPLDEHYRNDVIGGLGAFVLIADDKLSFPAAVRRKLVLEIAESRHPSGRVRRTAQQH